MCQVAKTAEDGIADSAHRVSGQVSNKNGNILQVYLKAD